MNQTLNPNPGTISDWIIAARKSGLDDLAEYHSNKLADLQRLRESGLPVFAEFQTPIDQYSRKNKALRSYFRRSEAFTIRALPDTSKLPRRFRINIHTFEEGQSFLDEVVAAEEKEHYTVFLTEYEPNTNSGIIVSRRNEVLIEIAPISLVELSHGEGVIPVSGLFAAHDDSSFRRMRYNTEDQQQRELMWSVLQYLREDSFSGYILQEITFKRGYFEFVVTDKCRVVFLDYKVNPAYLAELKMNIWG